MKLPFLISVPHAGLSIPNEIKSIATLTLAQIRDDSDDQASQIYSVKDLVADIQTFRVQHSLELTPS